MPKGLDRLLIHAHLCLGVCVYSCAFNSLSFSHHFHLFLTCSEVPLLLSGALNIGQVIE